MKIGVIGYTSKIGRYLIQRDCISLDCDVTKPDSIEAVLFRYNPDIIVNLASHSDPDWCENKLNFEDALAVNVRGAYNVAVKAEERGMGVVILSTDHIWNGKTGWDKNIRAFTKCGPYKEDYPKYAPVNSYGVTKLGMETLVLTAFDNVKVIRTSYCFDYNRLSWVLDGFKKGYPADFPDFIYRSFMHTEHFVDSFMQYLYKFYEMPKVLHISGNKTISWYDFMMVIAKAMKFNVDLVVGYEHEKEGFAPRPHKVGLNVELSEKLGLPQHNYIDGIRLLK